jgi:hypothetical protein
MASLKCRDWQGEDMARDFETAARKTGFQPSRLRIFPRL